MFNGYGEHQGAPASVLGHLAGRIGIALHKRYDAGGGQRTVLYRAAGRTDM